MHYYLIALKKHTMKDIISDVIKATYFSSQRHEEGEALVLSHF
jgi:hypothetical protein